MRGRAPRARGAIPATPTALPVDLGLVAEEDAGEQGERVGRVLARGAAARARRCAGRPDDARSAGCSARPGCDRGSARVASGAVSSSATASGTGLSERCERRRELAGGRKEKCLPTCSGGGGVAATSAIDLRVSRRQPRLADDPWHHDVAALPELAQLRARQHALSLRRSPFRTRSHLQCTGERPPTTPCGESLIVASDGLH